MSPTVLKRNQKLIENKTKSIKTLRKYIKVSPGGAREIDKKSRQPAGLRWFRELCLALSALSPSFPLAKIDQNDA